MAKMETSQLIRTKCLPIKDLTLVKEGPPQKFKKLYDVFLCGSLTRVRTETVDNFPREIIIFTVDDTSGCIDCFLETGTSKSRTEVDENLETDGPESPLAEMAKITALCAAKSVQVQDYRNFKLGTWVKVYGRLEEHNKVRFVRIKTIHEMKGLRKRVDYVKQLVHLCSNVYNKQ